ncbi:Mevalonate kinase [Fasciola gigantica]|uniref:Mevalonate kinase n=1 Tax=Fasciola gigantica TaxID=46835 RepID=A0A504ZAR5_FASGI|nr:Mevalonate kinase [Fasciola gigantica]
MLNRESPHNGTVKTSDIPFSVSAPGKVILFGEHAVVYGYPAIAAAIDLRCYFDCRFVRRTTEYNKEHPRVNFVFKDVESFCYELAIPGIDIFTNATCDQLREKSLQFSSDLNEEITHVSKAAILRQSVSVLNYLLLRCLQQHQSSELNYGPYLDDPELQITVIVHSEIQIGAGLGSSAAFSVAAATFFELLVGNLPMKLPFTLSTDQCDRIGQLAHEAEVIVHGNPSGIDTTISVQGGAIWFKRNADGSPSIEPLSTFPTSHFYLLIVDSQLNRSTKEAVRMVAQSRNRDPAKTERIFESIGKITEEAHHELVGLTDLTNMDVIANLIDRNQEALRALGVSSATLDRIADLLCIFGLSSKLTGAGIGGCVIGASRSMDLTALQRAADYMCNIGFPAKLVNAFSKGVFISSN